MNRQLVRAAAGIGFGVAAAVLLAGCGAEEKKMFGAIEVSDLSQTVEDVDAAWASHRANSLTGSQIHEDSRCYLQATEESLAESALCGPVRYMASETATWDSISLAVGNASDGKPILAYTGQFSSEAAPSPNAELFRPDGATPPEGVELDEPDTKALESLEVLTGTYPVKGSLEPVQIRTPDAVVTVTQAAIGQRAGGAEDRVKAPEGHVIVSTALTVEAAATAEEASAQFYGEDEAWEEVVTGADTELAFLVDGKEFPLPDASEAGPELSASIAVPGDGEKVRLAITFDGRTQTVNMVDGTVGDRIDALYAGDMAVAAADGQEITHGSSIENGVFAEVSFNGFEATRTAWNKEHGWAGDGKVWAKVPLAFSVSSDLYFHDQDDVFNGSYYDDVKLRVASASVGVGGEKIKAVDTGGEGIVDLLFAVPADQDRMNLDLSFSLIGALRDQESTGPATVSLNLESRTITLDFTN